MSTDDSRSIGLADGHTSGVLRLANASNEISRVVGGGRGVVDFAIRNRIHLQPGAILIMWAMPPWYESSPSWMAAPSVLLAGFGIYQLNRVFDFVEDEINDPSAYAKAYLARFALRNMATAAILASLLLSALFVGPAATALLTVTLLAGVLYSVPFFKRKRGEPRRIKQVIGLKNIIPSVAWPIAAVLYPGISSPDPHILQLFLAIALISCSVFIIEVAWDIRDSRGDRVAGISTLVTAFGRTRALLIPFGASSSYALSVALLVFLGHLSPLWLLPGFLPVLSAAIALRWKDSLAESRDRSHILVLINVLALIPLGLTGRWGA
ncbi:UbiA family prenyltransferase [Acrocarpospora sp. B8E8]|uniref:UbiA family prenyltransferase n=1 Tax=Acrocarpospora sp. B8E8 TaxID=3153572 RepID=UPI00325C5A18